ncbi:MAG: extracellular solute-binding protein [Treponema sp.]|jgi:multiple sugar transport system substrate-binding protein|nr:extracellular solute-binding protein [Treponema sp.]
MKKTVLFFMCIVLGIGQVFASGQKANTEGKTTVNFFTWWGDAEKIFGEALVADFEASHPNIHIEQTYVPYNDFHSKINTMIAAGNTPDVYLLNEFLINEWGEKGVGADLAPYYQRAGIEYRRYFLPQYLFTTGGKLWGVGSNPATIVLYYNKELFTKAGVDFPPESVTSPWTWQQFVDAARKLTKDSSGRGPEEAGFNYQNVVQWGTLMPTNWLYWGALLYGAQTSIVDANGTRLEMSKPAGTNIIQSIANLSLVDKVAPTHAMAQGSAFTNFPTLLMNGQLGMFIGGTFMSGEFINEKFDVGIAQIPSFTGKGGNMTWASGFQMRTGASQEAFEFFHWMANFDNWVQTSKKHNIALPGGLPTTSATLNDSAKREVWISVTNPAMSKVAGAILQEASRLGENVTVKNWAEIADQIIVPEFDKVWLGSETTADAMANLTTRLLGKFQGVWK